jgi:tryptophan synthase beta chain
VEDAATREDTNYALGSVLNHVCLHQTIIGLETKAQLAKVDEYPDIVIASCGGGSNFAGIAFPFVQDKITQGKKTRVIAVEPSACPTLTKGKFAYDYSDVAKLAPISMMYTLGHDFMPPGIHAGGLRYHGESPLVSQLYHDGLIEAKAVTQNAVFEAATLFARTEAILPAPESAHAIRAAIDEALACKQSGESKCIVLSLSGHGHFDLSSYDAYLGGNLEDYEYPAHLVEESLKKLPEIK